VSRGGGFFEFAAFDARLKAAAKADGLDPIP
jgi:hypothetical protein